MTKQQQSATSAFLSKTQAKQWRRSFKTVVAGVLFSLITLVFVFFGLTPQDMMGLAGSGVVALVNRQIIKRADYDRLVGLREEAMRQQFGGLPAEQMKFFRTQIEQQVLNSLIQAEVLWQHAGDLRWLVSDEEVRAQIVGLPILQNESAFSRERYDQFLAYYRMTPVEFESSQRKEIALRRFADTFDTALKTPSIISGALADVPQAVVDFEYIKMTVDAFPAASGTDGKKDTSAAQQKLDAAIERLEAPIKAQDSELLEKEIKKLGLKWVRKDAHPITSEYIAELGSATDLVDRLVDQELGRAMPQWVYVAGNRLVVRPLRRYIKTPQKTELAAAPKESTSFGIDFFQNYLDQLESQATIKR